MQNEKNIDVETAEALDKMQKLEEKVILFNKKKRLYKHTKSVSTFCVFRLKRKEKNMSKKYLN